MQLINWIKDGVCQAVVDSAGFENVTCDDGIVSIDLTSYIQDLIPPGWPIELETSAANPLAAALYSFMFPVGLMFGLIAIIAAGYKFMVSQGTPDKVKEASEQLTSAVTGIIFIALSLGLLQFIMKSLF